MLVCWRVHDHASVLQGVASAEDIDIAMVMGTNQPMGPLALADFIGACKSMPRYHRTSLYCAVPSLVD